MYIYIYICMYYRMHEFIFSILHHSWVVRIFKPVMSNWGKCGQQNTFSDESCMKRDSHAKPCQLCRRHWASSQLHCKGAGEQASHAGSTIVIADVDLQLERIQHWNIEQRMPAGLWSWFWDQFMCSLHWASLLGMFRRGPNVDRHNRQQGKLSCEDGRCYHECP